MVQVLVVVVLVGQLPTVVQQQQVHPQATRWKHLAQQHL
jgi:hypothetical protein